DDRRGRGERPRHDDRPPRLHGPRRGPRRARRRAARAAMKIVPAGESEQRLEGIWPPFLLNDAVSNRYWSRLEPDFPGFQFLLFENGELLAEANCVPVAGQPEHWRDALRAAFERGGEADRLCALAIMVSPAHRGRGLSTVMLEHMRAL